MSLLRETVREIVKRLFPQSFLSVDPGLALLDTAAAQALVGESGLKGLERQLESLDLRVVTLDVKRLRKSAGIGCRGKVSRLFW